MIPSAAMGKWTAPACASAGLALLASASCSSSTPSATPDDAGTDAGADVVHHGGELNDWACLGKVTYPPATSAPAVVELTVASPVGDVAAKNLRVRACPDRGDPSCAAGTPTQVTNDQGRATITVASGFDGYFESLEAGDVTNLHHVAVPILNTPHYADRVEFRAADLKLLTDTFDFALDSSKGQILVQAQDCNARSFPEKNQPFDPLFAARALAGGVTFAIDPKPAGVTIAYVVLEPKAKVRVDVTETADGYGGAGILNVPAGLYIVTATRAATGERIGAQRVVVRADTFSNVVLTPSP